MTSKTRGAGVANGHLGAEKDGNGRPNRQGGDQTSFGRKRGHLFKYLRHSSNDRWDFHIPEHD